MHTQYSNDLIERFWSKVDRSGDGCWLWRGTPNSEGYGRIYGGGREYFAHRVAYELANGPIPPGLLVCHRCDTPPCCRPDHLFVGTNADNTRDKTEKGRAASGDRHGQRLHPNRTARGERQGSAKLTECAVREIRSRYAAGGVRQTDLAVEFGVTKHTIHLIVRGRGWLHVDQGAS